MAVVPKSSRRPEVVPSMAFERMMLAERRRVASETASSETASSEAIGQLLRRQLYRRRSEAASPSFTERHRAAIGLRHQAAAPAPRTASSAAAEAASEAIVSMEAASSEAIVSTELLVTGQNRQLRKRSFQRPTEHAPRTTQWQGGRAPGARRRRRHHALVHAMHLCTQPRDPGTMPPRSQCSAYATRFSPCPSVHRPEHGSSFTASLSLSLSGPLCEVR